MEKGLAAAPFPGYPQPPGSLPRAARRQAEVRHAQRNETSHTSGCRDGRQSLDAPFVSRHGRGLHPVQAVRPRGGISAQRDRLFPFLPGFRAAISLQIRNAWHGDAAKGLERGSADLSALPRRQLHADPAFQCAVGCGLRRIRLSLVRKHPGRMAGAGQRRTRLRDRVFPGRSPRHEA